MRYNEVKTMLRPSTDCVKGKWAVVITASNPMSKDCGVGLLSYHENKADAEHNALLVDGLCLPAEAAERIAENEILDNGKV